MEVSNIVSLLGGVALFLFGMSVMGDSLKKLAGSKMEILLKGYSSAQVLPQLFSHHQPPRS